MKKQHIFQKIFLALIMLLGIISCQDRELLTVENQSAAILLDTSKETVFLDKNFPDNPALNLTWEVAKYTQPTELKYKIEASKTGDFAKPVLVKTVEESQRTATLTTSEMNAVAEKLGLAPNAQAPMYLRVTSFVGEDGEYVIATSNVSSVKITPYELVYPDFYLVGAAAPVGWDSRNAMLLTKNKEIATIVTTLKGGESFRFLGQQNWTPLNYSIDQAGTKDSYRYFKQVSSNIVQDGDENMKFTGTTGTYKITINAKEQSLTIAAQ